MITFSLQSGSNGNAIYVEAGDARLLFDAGISGDQAKRRMASRGRNIRDCDALIISHDHSDHTRCAGVFHRKFGLPVYMSPRVESAIRRTNGSFQDVRHYQPGDTLRIKDVVVRTIPTPHDGIDTVGFLVEHGGRKLAILTDLGCPFLALTSVLNEADAAYLEANYDPDMLRGGPYPEPLKRRIAGDGGHLSNPEAADVAGAAVTSRFKWLALAHLSQENNHPQLVLDTIRARLGKSLPLHIASRHEAGPVLEV